MGSSALTFGGSGVAERQKKMREERELNTLRGKTKRDGDRD